MKGKQLLVLGLVIFTGVNFLQSGLTELDPDEAYYWMFSQKMDWGYYDHPPGIVLMIKIGYALFQSEIGVRLFTILFQPLSFFLIWLMLGKPDTKEEVVLLILLYAAMPLVQVFGFIATPDSPLLFFSALFLWLYQRFLKDSSWLIISLLGICMAALLYSKYHGVLLIFFILLSNLALLRKPAFYIASFLGFCLFIPHLYWQIDNQFPSFYYHLFRRNDSYELKYTITYLLNQVFIFSPLLFPQLLWAFLKKGWEDIFEKGLYFVVYGFFFFFLLSSLRGHVEPHWTFMLSIPLIIITIKYSTPYPKFRKWLLILSSISALLILALRIWIIVEPPHAMRQFKETAWIKELDEIAGDLPVFFQNSYRDVSKFSFYTNNYSYTTTDLFYRPNQFDLWDWNPMVHNQRVLISGQDYWQCKGCDSVVLTRKNIKIFIADSLQVYKKIKARIPKWSPNWKPGESRNFKIELSNPYPHTINFNAGNMPLQLGYIILDDQRNEYGIEDFDLPDGRILLSPKESLQFNISVHTPTSLTPGEYFLGITIRAGDLEADLHSPVYPIIIK